MKAAFKEWAIVVDALQRGDQILIFRKGGISEGKGGFKMEENRFFLFPTLYHQQGQCVLPDAERRFQELSPTLPSADQVRISSWAEIVEWSALTDRQSLGRFAGQHIWKDSVLEERFDWGREQKIFALAVRVHRLPRTIDLPMVAAYGGCKSWIDLEQEIPLEGSQAVLDDAAFQERLKRFQTGMEGQ